MKETKNIVSVVNNDMAVVNKHFFSQLKELIVYQLPMIFLLGTLITDIDLDSFKPLLNAEIVLEKHQSFSFLENIIILHLICSRFFVKEYFK